ncbi:N-acetylmuramoyl-L-alanine amidase [uncultured Enterovirga sp.]|uniref:peptidoglycan recognition protein family protein n=1 Tax=uncultured Enterovirga sp. TaxID=2026352 RepID=UPI0035CC08B4
MDRVKLIQRALVAQGYKAGAADGLPGPLYDAAVRAFQQGRGLLVDGIVGPVTEAELFGLPGTREPPVAAPPGRVPAAWMPDCRMKGIVVHWTAGAHEATDLDRQHYHLLIEDDGRLVRGIPTIDSNAVPIKPGYAAHTLNGNGGMIGVSLCCMGGAIPSPFSSGPFPMTRAQWDALPRVLGDLCRRYGIRVARNTVLSHAEVQPTLGIAQRGKWDIARLSFDHSVVGPLACGDIVRARTAALLEAA